MKKRRKIVKFYESLLGLHVAVAVVGLEIISGMAKVIQICNFIH